MPDPMDSFLNLIGMASPKSPVNWCGVPKASYFSRRSTNEMTLRWSDKQDDLNSHILLAESENLTEDDWVAAKLREGGCVCDFAHKR